MRGIPVYTSEMTQSEQKIIRKAAAGDRMAFRELVLEHSHAMFRLAWRLTSDESAAEDVVQEAFIKAWRNLGKFRMESSFKSWLHRITVNTAMDTLRKQSRRRKFETAEPEFESIQAGSEIPSIDTQIDIRARTKAAMMKLSDTERSALLLKHFEGHSIKEIAQILEMTTGACKQTIFRAVKKMRVELRPLVTT
jgi:RNA polymerase sigma-70 factor (ECF subfamily)